MRPAAMGLIAAAAIRLSSKALKGVTAYTLMLLAFLASYFLGVPFILILLGSGIGGLLLSPQKPTPPAKPLRSWILLLLCIILFSGIGSIAAGSRVFVGASLSEPPAAISAGAGSHAAPEVSFQRLTEVAWLNTKAALLTFGGAYTVLPYLREQAVVRYRWMSDAQMMDALALGETTPGPLISIGVFISYLAAGFAGAVVGCFFLFLPSFVLVLTFARHIHKVEALPGGQAILWGVSAGTIGLILSLSAQLIPQSIHTFFSAAAAVITFVAVWRLKWNIVLVVMVAGIIGLMRAILG
jgi:chromate transporter